MKAESFDAGWLALREAADAAARDHAAAALGVAALAAKAPRGRERRVVDLGCGLGANLRWLAPRLGGAQRWLLVDRDAALLAASRGAITAWAGHAGHAVDGDAQSLRVTGTGFDVQLRWHRADLLRDAASLPWAHADLVTASALLDLLPAAALDALLDGALAAGCDQLWALHVDGRRRWQPRHADDGCVLDAFARHQRRDKGGGAALGPAAVAHLRRRLVAGGRRFAVARSDWALGPADAALLRELVAGDAAATREQCAAECGDAARVERWRSDRLAALPGLRALVGHVDVLVV